jgi:hypothetical protein|tara:strand:+ start:346 stop:603 length:258 start_codon:yes stop_codon:yes gene_type:complete
MRYKELIKEYGGNDTQMKITKKQGKEIELDDPDNPGVRTVVDLDQVDVDTDDPNDTKIKPRKKLTPSQAPKELRPGQKVTIDKDE